VRITPDDARFEIVHQGPPLTLNESREATSPALEDPTDRSLILMRAFMDEVLFGSDGKSITLVKRKAD
jgi:anti-sigma regulatory factor (Ser/Thr protein kinase)